MAKITEIVDPAFRSGTSKTGKPWTLMQIITDNGKSATMFAPAVIGDEVILKYNEEFKNYSAEKLTPQKQEKAQLEDTLKTILNSLGRIERHLGINTKPEAPEASEAPDLPPVDVYDQEPF